MKKIISILVLFFWIHTSYSQVTIQFANGKEFNLSTDDLINFTVLSPIKEEYVDISFYCVGIEKGDKLFEGNFNNQKIFQTPSQFNSKTYGISIQYNQENSIFNSSKLLRAGTYRVCVSIKLINQPEELASECEIYKNFPLNPPMLLYPDDESIVNTTQPVLSWIPPTPIGNSSSLHYRLNLVRLRTDQNKFESIASSSPILSLDVVGTNLLYPLNSIPLEFGQNYAWQVEAFEGSISLGRTEVWSFKVKRDSIEAIKEKYRLNNFTNVSEKYDNNFHISNEDLKIQLLGLNKDSANYTLYDASNREIAKIESSKIIALPDSKFVLLTNGSVKFKPNEMYKLVIEFNKKKYYYVFKFISNN